MTGPNREAFDALEKEWMAQTEFLDYRNWLQDELIKARGQARLSTQQEPWQPWCKIHDGPLFQDRDGNILCKMCVENVDKIVKEARLSTQREAFEKLRQQACDRACSAMPDEEMYAFSLGFEAGWQARLSTEAIPSKCADNDPNKDCPCGGRRGHPDCMFPEKNSTPDATCPRCGWYLQDSKGNYAKVSPEAIERHPEPAKEGKNE